MKRIENMRVLLSTISMVVLMFVTSCATSDRSVVPLADSIAPGMPSLNTDYGLDVYGEYNASGIVNGSGCAEIYFIPPTDLDLMCVVAEYQRQEDGEIITTKASPYVESLTVEGFGEAKPYNVKLYSVDFDKNESEAIYFQVNPTDPPHWIIYESLTLEGGYGGIELMWSNPSAINVMVDVYYQDEYKDMILLETFYSSGTEGYGAVRGLEEVAIYCGAKIRDHYGNESDWKYNTVTPLAEDMIEKGVGNYASVTALPGDSDPWSSGYGITDIFDGTYIDTGNSCYHSSSNAVSIVYPWNGQAITFDLGVTIRLSRFTLWPRGASHRYFTHNMIEYFTLYGAAELTESMYDTSNIEYSESSGLAIPVFDEWTVLRAGWDHDAYEAAGNTLSAGYVNFYNGGGHCYAPSGLSAGETASSDDLDWVGNNGHEFNVEVYPTNIRYVRLQCHSSWGLTDCFQLAEVDFYGSIQY